MIFPLTCTSKREMHHGCVSEVLVHVKIQCKLDAKRCFHVLLVVLNRVCILYSLYSLNAIVKLYSLLLKLHLRLNNNNKMNLLSC